MSEVYNSGSLTNFSGNSASTMVTLIQSGKMFPEKKQKEESQLVGIKCGIPTDIENLIGRDDDIARIIKSLSERRTVLLSGMAGIGKTLTSLRIVHEYVPEKFQTAAFINMENKSTIENSLKGFLKLMEIDWNEIMLENIKNMYSFFETNTCLLILDNIVETSEDIKNFIGEAGNEKIFILGTSQDVNLYSFSSVVNLKCLTEKQSIELLERELANLGDKYKTRHVSDIKYLVNKLGFHPLAIKSAGALIASMNENNNYCVKKYLDDYASFLKKTPEKCKGYYEKNVYASIAMNIDKVKRESLEAYELLCYLSFLESGGIKRRMFSDLPKIDFTITTLKRYNIIQIYESTNSLINIHRLIQTVNLDLIKSKIETFNLYKKDILKITLLFSEIDDVAVHFVSILTHFNEYDVEQDYISILDCHFFKNILRDGLNRLNQILLVSDEKNKSYKNFITRKIFRSPLKDSTDKDWRAVHYAVFYGHNEIVRKLHILKIPFDCTCNGWSVLHSAALTSNFPNYLFNPEVVEELKSLSDKLQNSAETIFIDKVKYMERLKVNIKICELLLLCLKDASRLKKCFKELVTNMDEDLLQAAEDGCNEVVKLFIDAKYDLNVTDNNGDSPLHRAIRSNNLKSARILIDAAVDVHMSNNDRFTPFHMLVANDSLDTIRYIIKSENKLESSSLFWSRGLYNDETFFHIAALYGRRSIIEYFVMYISEIEGWDAATTAKKLYFQTNTNLLTTPFHYAVLGGHLDVVKYIIELVNINDRVGSSILNLLLEPHTRDAWTVFHGTAFFGRINMIEYFITLISEIEGWNATTTVVKLYFQLNGTKSWTPFFLAVQKGCLTVVKYIVQLVNANHLGDSSLFNLLLEQKTSDGMTVFHIAAFYGRLNIIEYFIMLISKTEGWDVAATAMKLYFQQEDNKSFTPFYLAIKYGHVDIIKYIVELINADRIGESSFLNLLLEMKILNDLTVFHIAAYHGKRNIIEYFITLISQIEKLNPTTIAMKWFFKINNKRSWTPFLFAIKYGYLDIVRFMIELVNADDLEESSIYNFLLQLETLDYWTVFHLAVYHRRQNMIEYFIMLISESEKWSVAAATVKLYFQSKDNKSWTPLHLAVRQDYLDIIKYMIDLVNDFEESILNLLLEMKTSDGSTVFQIAASHGRLNIIEYFITLICEKEKWNIATTVMKLYFHRTESWSLIYAVQEGHLDIVKFIVELLPTDYILNSLLELKTSENCTVFHTAAYHGRLDMVQYFITLLSETENCNAATTAIKLFFQPKDAKTWTPLHHAVGQGHLNILKHIIDLINTDLRESSVLNLLLELKLGIQLTVFHIAAHRGMLRIIEYLTTLISKTEGWNAATTAMKLYVQLKDIRSCTPLYHATQEGHLDVVKYIVELAINGLEESVLKLLLEMKTCENWTVFHVAAFHGRLNIIEYFTTISEIEGWSPATTAKKLYIQTEGNESWTPLQLAVKAGHLNIVKYIEKSVDYNDLEESTVFNSLEQKQLQEESSEPIGFNTDV